MNNTRILSVEELKRDELKCTFLTHVGTCQTLYKIKVRRKQYKNCAPLVEVYHKNKKLYDWLEDGDNFDQLNCELGEITEGSLSLSGNEQKCSLFNRAYVYVLAFCILHDADPLYIDGFDWLMARLFQNED